jgi:ribosomal protein S12 methylthiotransferase accessory factor
VTTAEPTPAGPSVVLGHTGLWPGTCQDLAVLLAAGLSRHGAGSDAESVELSVLGARDELSAPPEPRRPSGSTPVHLYGHHAVVGPFPADAGASPCPRCLARRWQSVRSTGLRDALELAAGSTRCTGEPPWAVPFLADALAALIAARREQRVDHGFPVVHQVDWERLLVQSHRLVPDSDCQHCGGGAERAADTAEAAGITLAAVPKPAPQVFRRRGIESYRLPVAALVNPLAGMLGGGASHDLCSVSTSATLGCFTSRSAGELGETFWGGHTGSFRTSAVVGLLEGLERFAGMRARSRRTAVVGRYDDLADRAIDPRECGVYAEDFHRDRPWLRPFTPDREIPWVWGYSLRDRRPVLVPEVLAYYDAAVPPEDRFVQESSSGCASGGCLEEAVYFGLMEVIERDAFLIAWYGRAELPEIDPRSSTRAETRAIVDRLEMYGYRARFFDTRITFPIPVVTAVAERIDGGPGALSFGAGASLDPESALSSGLSEIATDAVKLRRMASYQGDRLREMAADRERVEGLHDHPMLYALPEMAHHADFLLGGGRERRSLAETFRGDVLAPGRDLGEDVRRCVDAVAAAGFDTVVVDQTAPVQRDLGFHTVKVLVPGLVPIDFGWARQRARHLPRTRTALRDSGLRHRALRPDELNPAPHPFP